jgi:hypothetical protein
MRSYNDNVNPLAEDLLSKFSLGNYDAQVIIDFLGSSFLSFDYGKGLKNKWDDQHPQQPCYLIDRTKFNWDKNCEALFHKDASVRIYILAHGAPSSDFFATSDNERVTIDKLVKRLAAFIGNHQRVVINIIACDAGRGDEADHTVKLCESSAAKLHRYLVAETKRDIPVIARMHLMIMDVESSSASLRAVSNIGIFKIAIDVFSKKYTIKKTADLNRKIDSSFEFDTFLEIGTPLPSSFFKATHFSKQPGAKVIYCLDANNQQVVVDAYYHLWKTRVLKHLAKLNAAISNEEKKTLLQKWLADFPSRTADYIAQTLQAEISKLNSVLRPSSALGLGLFIKTDPIKIIEELLEHRRQILHSKFTNKEIQPTDKKSNS